MKQRVRRLWLCVVIGLMAFSSLAQFALPARVVDTVNVRAEPARDGALLGQIAVNSDIVVEGRNQRGDWMLVSGGGLRGWVASRFVNWEGDTALAEVPVSTELLAASAPAAEAPANAANPSEAAPAAAGSAPIAYNIRTVFANGQALGNRPNVFIKVGDSLTAAQPYLRNIENNNYQLGPGMENIAQTIEYFRGSFQANSIAAQSGFTIGAIQDPLWSPQDVCNPNEWPLVCELRRSQPAFAIVLLGSQDVMFYAQKDYEYLLRTSVEVLIKAGTVPILTTFPTADWYHPDQSNLFNESIRRVAQDYRLPLIELREAAKALPNGGVQEDGIHLTEPPDGAIRMDLNGGQTQYGLTLREYLTLQVLDDLRRSLIGG